MSGLRWLKNILGKAFSDLKAAMKQMVTQVNSGKEQAEQQIHELMSAERVTANTQKFVRKLSSKTPKQAAEQ